jgi:GntR family transcriptional regulator
MLVGRTSMAANLADSIARSLVGEVKGPGDQLPSEAALCAQYRVSRGTVREALRLLEQRGLVQVQHGRGRFVSATGAIVKRPITEFESTTEMLASRGLEPVIRVLSCEVTTPDETEAEALGLPPTGRIVRLQRVRLSKGQPLVYQVDSFPARLLAPQRVEEIDFAGSLTKWLASRGHVLSSSAAWIRATVLPPSLATLGDVDSTTPWLLITEHVVDTNGHSVLFSRGYQRGDAFSFHVLRRRSSPRSGSA